MDNMLHNNPWGYKININNPEVIAQYKCWKRKKKIPEWCPLSDSERLDFERDFNRAHPAYRAADR